MTNTNLIRFSRLAVVLSLTVGIASAQQRLDAGFALAHSAAASSTQTQLNSPQAFAECKLLSQAPADKLSKGHSLSIRLFTTKNPLLYRSDTGKPFYTAEPLEQLSLALAEKLRDQLLQLTYFSSVVILPDDKAPSTDLVLEGEFTTIYQIGGKLQLIAYPVTRMAIKGRIKVGETSQQLVEFSCQSAREAGLINRPKRQMHKNIEKIAEGLKKLVESSLK